MKTVIKKDKLLYPELSFRINGILFQVRRDLGQYKNEQQYCDAIEQGFREAGLKYEREKTLPVSFRGEGKGRNKIDFLIEGKIILEVKAKSFITKEDYYQVKRYLAALNVELAILVNMRRHYVQPKRILNLPNKDRS